MVDSRICQWIFPSLQQGFTRTYWFPKSEKFITNGIKTGSESNLETSTRHHKICNESFGSNTFILVSFNSRFSSDLYIRRKQKIGYTNFILIWNYFKLFIFNFCIKLYIKEYTYSFFFEKNRVLKYTFYFSKLWIIFGIIMEFFTWH